MRPAFDKLEAVNRMLRAADEQPVNTLDNDGVNDTDTAQDILDQKMMQILGQGWYFNTEVRTLSPNTDGFIFIANSTLRVDGAGDNYNDHLTEREGKLYDLDNYTHVFTDPVEVEIVRWFAFDDIPLDFRYFIADSAARKYQQNTMNDPQRDRVLAEEEARSQANALRAETQQRDAVWGISKNSSTYRIRTRRRRDNRR